MGISGTGPDQAEGRLADRSRRRPSRAGLRLALAVCAGLALIAPASLIAGPAEKDAGQDTQKQGGDQSREAAVDAIGQDWVNRIQGRENAGAGKDQNGERIGPAPQADANGESVATSEDGSVRLQNPGATGDGADASANSGNSQTAGQTGDNASANANAGETLGVLPRSEGPSLFSVIFRFFGLMALMVGLFYVGMRYLRTRNGAPLMGGNDLVQVLVSTPLVQGKFLQIVDVAGRLMVLGVSDSGVQMLETIDDGVVADRIRIWQSRRAVNSPLPTSLLDQVQNVFKTSDLRFWVSGDERAKKAPGFASFGELLSGQVPTAAGAGGGSTLRSEPETVSATGGARRGRRKAAENVDLFDDQNQELSNLRGETSVDVPEEQVPDEIALKNLLKQQKRRLAGINRKKRDDSK